MQRRGDPAGSWRRRHLAAAVNVPRRLRVAALLCNPHLPVAAARHVRRREDGTEAAAGAARQRKLQRERRRLVRPDAAADATEHGVEVDRQQRDECHLLPDDLAVHRGCPSAPTAARPRRQRPVDVLDTPHGRGDRVDLLQGAGDLPQHGCAVRAILPRRPSADGRVDPTGRQP